MERRKICEKDDGIRVTREISEQFILLLVNLFLPCFLQSNTYNVLTEEKLDEADSKDAADPLKSLFLDNLRNC